MYGYINQDQSLRYPGATPGVVLPNGPLQQPNFIVPVYSYEQQMQIRQQLFQQQREFIARRLKENFPTKFVIIYVIVMCLIGIAAIGLQIGMFVVRSVNYYIAGGFWGGAACFGLALLAFFLCEPI